MIRFKEVLLIGYDGKQYGLKSSSDALTIAMNEGYDLVCVAPNANPPVCKLLDYSRYRYEQQKRSKEAKKNQKVMERKEVRLSPVIDTGDFETKLKMGRKFLEKGNRLKVSIRFTGRMMPYQNQGREMISKYVDACLDIANKEKDIVMEGRMMSIDISPKSKKELNKKEKQES